MTESPSVAYSDSREWDDHVAPFLRHRGGRWRTYCDHLHLLLVDTHLPSPGPRILKTDLFDEIAGEGLTEILLHRSRTECVFGIDIAASVVSRALQTSSRLVAPIGDLRHLPFDTCAFDDILSNSSLDHFHSRNEIRMALRELHRVLRPGGRLLVTLDNLSCPVIAVRAVLPFRLLRRLGLMKYPAGATLTRRGLAAMLKDVGFEIMGRSTLMHVPRILAIPLCSRADRRDSTDHSRTVRRLLRWEIFGRLPTRLVTGHFIAVLARRPEAVAET